MTPFGAWNRRQILEVAAACRVDEVTAGDALIDFCHTATRRRLPTQTIDQTAQAMVTIGKLGGRLNIADAHSPSHTAPRLTVVEMAIARTGRGVSMIAVAAGVTTSANNSSVPTACTAMVTDSPSSAMNVMDRTRTGTPLASATTALTELNSKGR